MQSENVLALVFERNAFYRRQYFLALGAFALSVVVICMLLGVLIFIKRNPTQPLYFATDSIGRLIPIIPLNKPNMKTEDVVAWTEEAIEKTYSYDYVNYHSQFQNAQKYFTTYGWTNYLTALTSSKNIVALTEKKMLVIAQVTDKPKIFEGILGGAYAWKMEMPVLVTYWLPPYDDQSRFSNPLTVSVLVQRQSLLQSYKGLGIVQLIGTSQVSTTTAPPELSNTPAG